MRVFPSYSARMARMEAALARPQLVTALNRRWDFVASSVVAGAGYGKSTSLLGAIDGSKDKTHDRFLSLGGATAAEEFVHALARCWEFGLPPSNLGEAVHWLASAWWARSPNDVCTTVDNAHHLDAHARTVLAQLIAGCKANTHLLLAGRSLVIVGAPVLLDESTLRFGDDELTAIAAKTGTPVLELAAVQGCPPPLP